MICFYKKNNKDKEDYNGFLTKILKEETRIYLKYEKRLSLPFENCKNFKFDPTFLN
jgi:hypothetical protein